MTAASDSVVRSELARCLCGGPTILLLDEPMEGLPPSISEEIIEIPQRLGPQAAYRSFAEPAAATEVKDPFAQGGVLAWMNQVPAFAPCLADPLAPPDLSNILAVRERDLESFTTVMTEHGLDALVLPQTRDAVPALHGPDAIRETTVCEIDIAGFPSVVVPAGRYAPGSPFCLIVVGPLWSEAGLLGFAYDSEQVTGHRQVPAVSA